LLRSFSDGPGLPRCDSSVSVSAALRGSTCQGTEIFSAPEVSVM
jgi:hypothetical protein